MTCGFCLYLFHFVSSSSSLLLLWLSHSPFHQSTLALSVGILVLFVTLSFATLIKLLLLCILFFLLWDFYFRLHVFFFGLSFGLMVSFYVWWFLTCFYSNSSLPCPLSRPLFDCPNSHHVSCGLHYLSFLYSIPVLLYCLIFVAFVYFINLPMHACNSPTLGTMQMSKVKMLTCAKLMRATAIQTATKTMWQTCQRPTVHG